MYSADVQIKSGNRWVQLCVSFDAPTFKLLKSATKKYVKKLHPNYKGKIKLIDIWEFVEKRHKDTIL